METRITEDGQIEISTKIDAQEYIQNKLREIEMLSEQISENQRRVEELVNEIKAIQ